MFGLLPITLLVDSKQLPINSDYRVAIRIFDAFNDVNADDDMKIRFMIETLYQNPEEITNLDEAVQQAIWYLNVGSEPDKRMPSIKVYDWAQDEQMIFSAVNKVSGKELRTVEYLHYWTFMGYFQEIEEGLLTYVINIRQKRSKKQKLSKEEMNFYIKNKELVDLKRQYTESEQAEIDAVNAMFK